MRSMDVKNRLYQCYWRNWSIGNIDQFVIFKLLSYCLEETIGFDVNVSFASGPVSRLIR